MKRATLLAASLAALAIAAPVAASAEDTLLIAGRIILPHKAQVMMGGEILVRDGRIVAVGRKLAAPGAKRMDLSGYTVLPGLIDAHTHLTVQADSQDITDELKRTPASAAFDSIGAARDKLMSGFTTVREAGTYWAFVDVALRDAIERGAVVGPRVLAAGAFVSMPNGAGAVSGFGPSIELPLELRYGEANGVDGMRATIRRLSSHGVDVIKTFGSGAVISHSNTVDSSEFTPAELEAAVDEARALGLKVMAHAHSSTGIKNAVRAGAASIEHGSTLDDETIAMMKAKGTYLVPTLSVWDCTGKGDAAALINSREFGPRAQVVYGRHRASFTKAAKAGVKIGLGSDSSVCGPTLGYRELEDMVKFGLTPMQALQAATSNNADLLGRPEVGAIAEGKAADLIAVAGDPIADMSVMSDVKFVMKGGTIYKQ